MAKHIKKNSLYVLLWLLPTLSVFADGAGSEWENLNREVEELYRMGNYDRAVTVAKKSLEVAEKNAGPDHPDVAQSLNNLALLYKTQGQYAEAEPLYKRALTIQEMALGPEHPDVATSLNNLAELYRTQGYYAQAEPLYKRSLAIREKAFGPEHTNVAGSLNNLAGFYYTQGRYAEAEPLYKRSLAIYENTLGPEHPDVATSLNNLALLYHTQGRYAQAEPLYQRSLTIREKALGPDHPDVALSLNNLAFLYATQGRYAEAEPLYKRALTIYEKALGLDHPNVAQSLNNLAEFYRTQGQYAEAEPLFKRSLVIYEKALGPEHPDVALSLNNLAFLYATQGRYAEAEPLYKRALTIFEKALGLDHPNVALSLNNLAGLYDAQGQYAQAEPLYKRALAIWEKALGPEHPYVALSLNNLALLYATQGRYAEAEPFYKRSLAIWEKALGPEHPDVAQSLSNLAAFYDQQSQTLKALDSMRRASAIYRNRFVVSEQTRTKGAASEHHGRRGVFVFHIALLTKAEISQPAELQSLIREGFEIGQLATGSGAGEAVSRMAVRFASGEDALAKLVRQRQDALIQWQAVDAELVNAASQPPDKRNAEHELRLQKEMTGADTQLKELDTTLAQRFPAYQELTRPQPSGLEETQQLLAAEEALISYLVGDKESYLWVVRKDNAAMHRIALPAGELKETVQQLRKLLDPTNVTKLTDIQPFDIQAAYALYQHLFSPVEPFLNGITHLIIVPDGPLQSLPFGVLVTEPYNNEIKTLNDYRNVPWLAKKYAITVLPSVSSLRALRTFARGSVGEAPFTGFGDPVLGGEGSEQRGINIAALFSRGAVANVDEVRQLPSLPDTADELTALAKIFKADTNTIYLRQQATERKVKSMDLRSYRTVVFATHGLMAGEFKGLAEPALVLTPPKEGSAEDDGLLTASEVAQLKLNADWVLLSACNTAAADGTPGAEGLSGLAKAFFYAGSRSLLVSHWAVSSDATVQLTTRMFDELAQESTLGKAEALRRSMMALMNNDEKPYYAHPMFWAPFVVVGEGGTLH